MVTHEHPGTLPADVTLTPLAPDDPRAARILAAYLDEVASRYYGRPALPEELADSRAQDPDDVLAPPRGFLLVALAGDEPVACGGLRFEDPGDDGAARKVGPVAELTRVFVVPAARRRGIAVALLAALEDEARSRGVEVLRLDTRSDLVEARTLYARLGYREVPAFSSGPYAEHWFTKNLREPRASVGA